MRISDWSSDVCSSDLKARTPQETREDRAMDKREDSLPPDDATIADDREAVALETELDEDDRLKPEFVRDVIELAEAGEGEAARERVGGLHPADRKTAVSGKSGSVR